MSRDDKIIKKREVFTERTRAIIPKFRVGMLRGQRRLSIRVNTLKSQQTFERPIEWAPNCYWFDGEKSELTHSKDFEEGRIYLQNAASFIPPILLDLKPSHRILDICAAPGGKASHIAALTNNKAELWVNDNSRTRLNRMITNLQRLGVKPHNTTLYAVDTLRHQLPHDYYDRILLDAPCSGEGMITLDDPHALDQWSVAQIKRLQRIQKKAISTAWDLLRPGGVLVYSTCTMAPEENEAVIDYLLRKQETAQLLPIELQLPNRIPTIKTWNNKSFANDLSHCLRLGPSEDIEAFFVAVIRKPKI
ncbi:MAG TPA: RsmB/NOP family class I SAM-dependent RNA methyltransferase [Candidatus Saccharimonadales bacterium]|nr:RsmB/NOP family class I SAM-dependent RNA methyltransferase [Candidatus Saccharimonadales bacterium]